MAGIRQSIKDYTEKARDPVFWTTDAKNFFGKLVKDIWLDVLTLSTIGLTTLAVCVHTANAIDNDSLMARIVLPRATAWPKNLSSRFRRWQTCESVLEG